MQLDLKIFWNKLFLSEIDIVKESLNFFFQMNGFSNSYWGWGGEDDDMNQRIKKKGFRVIRPFLVTCRFG